MNVTRHSATILAALAALPAQAQAQQAFDLGQIVISANFEETEETRSGASVTVLSEEDLKARGDTRVVDVLARLPGVTVRTAGPIGTTAGISIRGASQNYVAVIVDGIDVTDPSSTQVAFDFGALNTADVSRIEVLRGSQSALYGSGAVGGMVNITTRRATEEGTVQSVLAEAGSYNTARLSWGFARKTGPTDVALTLSHVQTDGFSAADENDGNTEPDGFRADRISARVTHVLDSGVELTFSGFVERSTADYDEGFPLADGTPNETVEARSAGFRAAAVFETGRFENTVSATYYRIDRHYDGADFFGSASYSYTGTRTGLTYRGATDLSDRTRLVFGADLTSERYQQAGDFGAKDASTTLAGLSAELTSALSDRVDVTATLRHDDHSRFGGFTTGRLSAVYRATEALTLRAVVATGFRAPSNYELFGDFVGNPNLQPEESESLEVGAEYRFATGTVLRATAFQLTADNLIDYNTATFSYTQVPGLSRRKGLEVAADVPVSDRLRLTGSYTYTDSTRSAATSWDRVPVHAVALGAEADLTDRLRGAIGVEHAAGRATLPDYTVASATLTYDVGQGAEAYLRVENLFDEEYQLIQGYGTSDRAIYVGLRKRF